MVTFYRSRIITPLTDLNELQFIPESYGNTFRIRTNGKATWLLATDIIYNESHMANHSINNNTKLWDIYLVSGDIEYIPKCYNYKGIFTPTTDSDYAISLKHQKLYWKPYVVYECLSIDTHDNLKLVVRSNLTTLTIKGTIQVCNKFHYTMMPIYVDKYRGYRSIRHLKKYLFDKEFINA